jgi:hypothetical protein
MYRSPSRSDGAGAGTLAYYRVQGCTVYRRRLSALHGVSRFCARNQQSLRRVCEPGSFMHAGPQAVGKMEARHGSASTAGSRAVRSIFFHAALKESITSWNAGCSRSCIHKTRSVGSCGEQQPGRIDDLPPSCIDSIWTHHKNGPCAVQICGIPNGKEPPQNLLGLFNDCIDRQSSNRRDNHQPYLWPTYPEARAPPQWREEGGPSSFSRRHPK